MYQKTKKYPKTLLLLVILWANVLCLSAQNSIYKFPITEEGVYKITADKARELGANGVADLRILGFPGMLPQKLDSNFYELQEIPVQIINEDLYFFLTSPRQFSLKNQAWTFEAHYYMDSLFYFVETQKPSGNRVEDITDTGPAEWHSGNLFQLKTHKKEEFNLLSSGRNWYGDRLFDGENSSFSFQSEDNMSGQLYYQASIMAQSLTESNYRLQIQQENLEPLHLPAIPNATYGIKGREIQISGFTQQTITGNTVSVNSGFQSNGDRNASAYVAHLVLGLPFSSNSLGSGTYYNLMEEDMAIETGNNSIIWDLTDFFAVKSIGTKLRSDTRKISVFNLGQTREIQHLQKIEINLRSSPEFSDLIIITNPLLLPEARQLASFKNQHNISAQVVTINEIYDNFGYGNRDITAIRNFLAFQFLEGKKLKNVLFFGKGTFDYKDIFGGRPNLVPTYSSRSSLNPLTTYSSDDYFGFLDYGEGEWEEDQSGDHRLSIGIGRLPVINRAEAREVVQKIMDYKDPAKTTGDWKRKVLFVADDGDNNIHLNDAESHASYLLSNHPEMRIEKLYLDSYEQIQAGSSQRSPEATDAFRQNVEDNVLLINYIGHGNETTLAAEQLFTVSDIADWKEDARLPVFVTATCEFGRHDSPFIRSAAEELLMAGKKGAIALLTTGRPVFSSINFALNKAFVEAAFTTDHGENRSLGEIFRDTKNNSLNGALNRNFSLLGDPSLRLNLPELKVNAEGFYDIAVESHIDTLQANQRITYQGAIIDPLTQATISNFNGEYEVELNDKPVPRKTLGDESEVTGFWDDNVILHRGRGKVENGKFQGELWVPKNINYDFGKGIFRVFAENQQNQEEAMGAMEVVIGGTSDPPFLDAEGPLIQLFLEDGITLPATIPSTSTRFVALLEDESGINVSGLNIGQNISLTINDGETISLNAYYKALEGGYRKGMVDYPLTGLKEGNNTLLFQVWDNLGNFSQKETDITVSGSNKLKILEQSSYPNPASHESTFRIRHNRQGDNLLLKIRIFSVLGSEIFSLERRFPRANPILDDIVWIFLQSKLKYPTKGTYLYSVELQSEDDGTFDQKGGKIIIK